MALDSAPMAKKNMAVYPTREYGVGLQGLDPPALEIKIIVNGNDWEMKRHMRRHVRWAQDDE